MDFDIAVVNRRKYPVTVFDVDGSVIARIGPGDAFEVTTDDPYKLLARYSQVVFHDKGVELVVRPGWAEPEREWPLLVEMSDHSPSSPDYRMVAGASLCVQKGIPVIIEMVRELTHDWAMYQKIVLNVPTQQRVESKQFDGIYEHVTVLQDEPMFRTDAELEQLKTEIEAVMMAASADSSRT